MGLSQNLNRFVQFVLPRPAHTFSQQHQCGRPNIVPFLLHFSPGNEIRIRAKQALPINEWTHVACTYDGSSRANGLTLYLNGKRHDSELVRDNLYKDIVYRTEWGDQVGKDKVDLRCAIGGR